MYIHYLIEDANVKNYLSVRYKDMDKDKFLFKKFTSLKS